MTCIWCSTNNEPREITSHFFGKFISCSEQGKPHYVHMRIQSHKEWPKDVHHLWNSWRELFMEITWPSMPFHWSDHRKRTPVPSIHLNDISVKCFLVYDSTWHIFQLCSSQEAVPYSSSETVRLKMSKR